MQRPRTYPEEAKGTQIWIYPSGELWWTQRETDALRKNVSYFPGALKPVFETLDEAKGSDTDGPEKHAKAELYLVTFLLSLSTFSTSLLKRRPAMQTS